jgi:hypothetical protein
MCIYAWARFDMVGISLGLALLLGACVCMAVILAVHQAGIVKIGYKPQLGCKRQQGTFKNFYSSITSIQ